MRNVLFEILLRLIQIYRKEDDKGVDMALNFLSTFILSFVISFLLSIWIILFGRPVLSSDQKFILGLLGIGLFFGCRELLKKTYSGEISNATVKKKTSKFKFNLFTLMMIMLAPWFVMFYLIKFIL